MLKQNDTPGRRNPENVVSGPQSSVFATFPLSAVSSEVDSDPEGDGGTGMCSLIAANLAAYQDGELNPQQNHVVESHLSNCPDCTDLLDALQTNDRRILREWRDEAPLPSSFERKRSIDAIMAALPPTPEETADFAPKRIHARTRWMRFATGTAGVLALIGLMWSSYRLGYAHGRLSSQPENSPTSSSHRSESSLTTPATLRYAGSSSSLASRPSSVPTLRPLHRAAALR